MAFDVRKVGTEGSYGEEPVMKWIFTAFVFLTLFLAGQSWAASGACTVFWSEYLKVNTLAQAQQEELLQSCKKPVATLQQELELLGAQKDKCQSLCNGKKTTQPSGQLCDEMCLFIGTRQESFVKGYYHGLNRGQASCSNPTDGVPASGNRGSQ